MSQCYDTPSSNNEWEYHRAAQDFIKLKSHQESTVCSREKNLREARKNSLQLNSNNYASTPLGENTPI
jgi:hypothetical protein